MFVKKLFNSDKLYAFANLFSQAQMRLQVF